MPQSSKRARGQFPAKIEGAHSGAPQGPDDGVFDHVRSLVLPPAVQLNLVPLPECRG